MISSTKIYVAGHRGMVGSAIVRTLLSQGASADSIITRTHAELDLCNQAAVNAFFARERPNQVYLAAARVGGIHANNTYPADFIYDNLMVQANVIQAAHAHGLQKLLFLGSSETVGTRTHGFAPIDAEQRIFARTGQVDAPTNMRTQLRVPSTPSAPTAVSRVIVGRDTVPEQHVALLEALVRSVGHPCLVLDENHDLVEVVGEIRLRRLVHRVAEFLDRRLMGPGAFRAEVGDGEIVLQSKGGGHDFPIDRADGFLRQAAFVHFDEPAEEGFLALGSVDLQAVTLFHHAHFVNEVRAARKEV